MWVNEYEVTLGEAVHIGQEDSHEGLTKGKNFTLEVYDLKFVEFLTMRSFHLSFVES